MSQLQERNALLVTENESLKARRDALAENEGYMRAFYEMAEILGIGARADSPKNVFEQVIKPMLFNIQKERGQLAAENVSLKILAEACSCEYEGAATHDCLDEEKVSYPEESCNITFGMIRRALKTPATDAYLNSVRAEGADKVAEYHFVRIDALKDVSRQGHLFHKAAHSDAVNVANLFRANKDGE